MKQHELSARGKPWLTEEFCPGVERDGAGNLYLAISPQGILGTASVAEWPKDGGIEWLRYPEELDELAKKVAEIVFCPGNDGVSGIKERRAAYQRLQMGFWRGGGRLSRTELLAIEDKILLLAGHRDFAEKKNRLWQKAEEVRSSIAFDSRHEIVKKGTTSRRQKMFLRQSWRADIALLESLPSLAIFSWTLWAAERLRGIIGPRPTSVRPDRVSRTLSDIRREFARCEARRCLDQLIVAAQMGCPRPEYLNRFVMSEVERLDNELRSAGVEFPPFRYHHLNLVGRLKAFQNSF